MGFRRLVGKANSSIHKGDEVSDDATIRDLQVSLERVTEDRDRVRSIAHEMARLMKRHGLDFYEVCHRFEKEYHNEPA